MIIYKFIKEHIVSLMHFNEKYLAKEFMAVLLSLIEFLVYTFLHYFNASKYIKKTLQEGKANTASATSLTSATWTWIIVTIVIIFILDYLALRIFSLMFDKIYKKVTIGLLLMMPPLVLYAFYYEYWNSLTIIMIILFLLIFNGAFVVFISIVYRPFFNTIVNILFNNDRDDSNTINRLNFIYLIMGGIIAWIIKK